MPTGYLHGNRPSNNGNRLIPTEIRWYLTGIVDVCIDHDYGIYKVWGSLVENIFLVEFSIFGAPSLNHVVKVTMAAIPSNKAVVVASIYPDPIIMVRTTD